MITTVLLDLYGTLIELQRDSRPYHTLVKRLPTSEPRKVLRQSLINSCESLTKFSNLIGLPDQKDIHHLETELTLDISSATLFEDSLPTLGKFKEKGVKIGLISNLASPYRQPIKSLGLEEYFDVIVFSCDIGVAKPDQSIYNFALEELGSSPAETIMIGDSFRADAKGPANLGITGFQLVRNGTHNKSNVINGLDEIVERICTSSDLS